jgi:hypothetical protein
MASQSKFVNGLAVRFFIDELSLSLQHPWPDLRSEHADYAFERGTIYLFIINQLLTQYRIRVELPRNLNSKPNALNRWRKTSQRPALVFAWHRST